MQTQLIELTHKRKVTFESGNRCGFQKGVFRSPTPLSQEVQSRMPKFIKQMQDEIRKNGIPGVTFRAERDEAVRAVLCVLLDYTDLWTCRIGTPTKDGWLAFGWDTILARIPWLSAGRLWEVVCALRDNYLFDSNQRLADPRYKTKDFSKPSGYAISNKGFTDYFWTCFRQTKRWKHEAEDKARRIKANAEKIGKTVSDFYKAKNAATTNFFENTWAKTNKTSVKTLAAAGMAKKQKESEQPSAGPSLRAIEMILDATFAKAGVINSYALAKQIASEHGQDALINPERFIS